MAIGKRYKIALGLLAFTLFGWAGCAMAQPGPSKAAPMAKGISNFSWHDGKRTRTVWMRSDMVAEFPKPGTRSLSGDGPPVSGATSLPVRGNLRLWKLPVGVNATTVKNLSLGSRSDSFSPVFLAP